MEPETILACDSMEEIRPGSDELVPQHFEILSGDAGEGGLLKIRQFAARADARNLNRRVYPREVIQAAIDEARKMARAGAMLCEMRHPEVAKTSAGERYTHNPERVTARVDDISDVQHDGRIFVDRTILDTPMGRIVADAFRSKRPIGISTRFRMRSRTAVLDGDSVDVATWMEIHTWDDVENPAVVGAGEPVPLSDSVLQSLSTPPPAPQPTTQPPTSKHMNLQALRAAFAALIVASADAAKVATARTDYHAGFLEADAAGKAEERAHAVTLELDAIRAGYKFEELAPPSIQASLPKVKSEAPAPGGDSAPVLTKEQAERVEALLARDEEDRQRDAVKAAVDGLATHASLKDLAADTRTHVLERTLARATKPEEVEAIAMDELNSAMSLISEERLKAAGFVKADGKTVITVTREARPWMEGVDKILAAADDHCVAVSNGVDPHDPAVKARRKRNREQYIEPMLEGLAKAKHGADSLEGWFNANDPFAKGGEKAFGDSLARLAADNTTTAQVYNQPTIVAAFVIQAFQDMQMLEYVQSFGPSAGPAGNWEKASDGIGSVLRLPVEYYEAPANYGVTSGTFDAGLLVPEGVGIDEATVRTRWLSFAPAWRRIAASVTADATRAMANGPANYGLIGRTLFHMAYDKSRRVDKALADEMLGVSDEYGAVSVAGEAYTNGNGTASLNLANNSVFNGGGSQTVNLNPAKTAAAAVAAGDPSVTYGANVVAALRLRTRGAANNVYAGTAFGTDPVVRPRTSIDLTAAGAVSSSTKNPFTVTAPVGMVMGYLDGNGQIQAIPGIANPTFAVDWENGVVVFNATAGLAGAGGAVTTAITVSYAYATNFDNFVVNNPTLNNQTLEAYLNGLLGQFDKTAALMGSSPRYAKPNLALMTLGASTWITRATLFYKLNSPDGTDLFPTEDYFFRRTGIMGARHNAPWNGGDRRILMTRRGATKYGVDTPFEMRGPFPKYDANGRVIASDIYYGQENSVIATPQVTDQNDQVLNPYNRTVLLR